MSLSAEDREERSNRIYDEKLKARLEAGHMGEVVAIHAESGEYFLGRDPLDACDKGRARFPGAIFYCRRVGDAALYRIGAF